ncbi:MAG TPA: aminopeptidase P N-terminal domain-containing protein [Myxococcota bacterium]|nr:aminopeptidase P N-terminal domain-containing protein [Myxococcota bacterium]HQK52323.1 aminopeptidase P N-terminal domain-containing protein [Myxococcota bacterium]
MAVLSKVYVKRRTRFFDWMQDGVAVFASWPVYPRNGDVEHPYRPDSDLHFLTGFDEPESAAVLVKKGQERRFLLFVRPRDPEMETWVGSRAGEEGAVRDFGADEAHPIGEFESRLGDLLTNQPCLYLSFGLHPDLDRKVLAIVERLKGEARRGICGPFRMIDPREFLRQARLVKDREEIGAVEKACDITRAGFEAAFRAVMPGMPERELQAVVEFEFRRRGADRVSFETICAGGAHATTLHYIRNDGLLRDGDLVLLDAGAEVAMASGDITRTFPVNGRFSRVQRRVYEWVLQAQAAAIEAIRPGATYAQVHQAALEVLVEGLRDLKVLRGKTSELIETGAYRPYFMHRIGHWLGMDVHDVGPYFVDGASIPLQAGMVMTVEPGLYFADRQDVPRPLRGIGIRIEDDVLVTPRGRRVLTEGLPKTVDEIEKVLARPGAWWGEVRPLARES